MTATEAVLTVGLVPAPVPMSLAAEAANELIAAADSNGVLSLLGVAVNAGVVEVPAEARELIANRWLDHLSSVATLDACLLEVTHATRHAGVPFRVLEGCANAHLDELAPSWRTYGEIDVLVPSDQLTTAVKAVAVLGFHRRSDPVRVSRSSRFGNSVTLAREDGTLLDLHRMLATGPLGVRVQEDTLFARGEPFAVGGSPLSALHVTHRFLHACYQARLGGAQLWSTARDIALLSRRVDPDELGEAWCEGWSATVVARAVGWASDLAPGACAPRWEEWIALLDENGDDLRVMAAYDGSSATLARAQFAGLASVRDRVRFAAGILVPSRHIRDRGESKLID